MQAGQHIEQAHAWRQRRAHRRVQMLHIGQARQSRPARVLQPKPERGEALLDRGQHMAVFAQFLLIAQQRRGQRRILAGGAAAGRGTGQGLRQQHACFHAQQPFRACADEALPASVGE